MRLRQTRRVELSWGVGQVRQFAQNQRSGRIRSELRSSKPNRSGSRSTNRTNAETGNCLTSCRVFGVQWADFARRTVVYSGPLQHCDRVRRLLSALGLPYVRVKLRTVGQTPEGRTKLLSSRRCSMPHPNRNYTQSIQYCFTINTIFLYYE